MHAAYLNLDLTRTLAVACLTEYDHTRQIVTVNGQARIPEHADTERNPLLTHVCTKFFDLLVNQMTMAGQPSARKGARPRSGH